MSSIGPNQAELDGTIQDLNEGNGIGTVFQHPKAPRIVPKELPDIDQSTQQHPMAINYGHNQWIPHVLLFCNDIHTGIDSRLAYLNEARAVAQPAFTCMPASAWGAVGMIVVTGESQPKTVGFEEAFDPATRPPVERMIIGTDSGNIIIASAEQGRTSVTVVDVQRAVIRWMKETRTNFGSNNLTKRFSKSVRMIDEDGSEAEFEIWVWKGLIGLSADMIQWRLHL